MNIHTKKFENVHLSKKQLTVTSFAQRQVKYFKGNEYQTNSRGEAKRCNLNNELNLLVTIWNWAKGSEQFEHIIGTLPCPVHKKHGKVGKIREIPQKHRKISTDEMMIFLSYLSPIYRDLAYFQFLTAGRISEAVG